MYINFTLFTPKLPPLGVGSWNLQSLVSLPYWCYIPYLVKIGPVVFEKKMLTHEDGRQPIVIGQLSDSVLKMEITCLCLSVKKWISLNGQITVFCSWIMNKQEHPSLGHFVNINKNIVTKELEFTKCIYLGLKQLNLSHFENHEDCCCYKLS